MDLGLKDKRAIVTGGNRGIGRCCALALARENARVCITARNQELLDQAVEEIHRVGGEGHAISADLTHPESCEQVVQGAADAFGGIDILINCAGAAGSGDVLTLSTETIDRGLGLKSFGYLRMAQLVIPYMKQNRWGRIVNIAGSAGTSPARNNMPTSLANITILNMTRALSDAVSEHGILVNTICPGLTNTQRARDMQRARADTEGRDVEEVIGELGRNLPARRIAEPEEVADVAAFMASEPCSYVFGSSIYMDGGGRRGTP
ncbi:MAG: SDR family oxidoreductase [Gemmatimonadota bacterium]|uniref:Short-chain dehydrogenase n=1 Tax=marine metagenome TaxID=408172 RepID=A0A382WV35_9ZZZZ|nr:SDR family oxidoreductase [Gemmatimonadota bacterium]